MRLFMGNKDRFWALVREYMWSPRPQIYFTRSLGIEEVHLCDHIGIGMNIGGSNMILTIQNHAIHNVAV